MNAYLFGDTSVPTCDECIYHKPARNDGYQVGFAHCTCLHVAQALANPHDPACEHAQFPRSEMGGITGAVLD